jgi:hypothetical protein
VVYRARQHAFACAAFAGQEDGCVDRGGTAAELAHGDRGIAMAEDGVEGRQLDYPGWA